jgi:hypothetical protein
MSSALLPLPSPMHPTRLIALAFVAGLAVSGCSGAGPHVTAPPTAAPVPSLCKEAKPAQRDPFRTTGITRTATH